MPARDALKRLFRQPILGRSLTIAIVVGTILNAINQGPEILNGAPPVLWKLLLTYVVPFLVASFGAYSALCDQ